MDTQDSITFEQFRTLYTRCVESERQQQGERVDPGTLDDIQIHDGGVHYTSRMQLPRHRSIDVRVSLADDDTEKGFIVELVHGDGDGTCSDDPVYLHMKARIGDDDRFRGTALVLDEDIQSWGGARTLIPIAPTCTIAPTQQNRRVLQKTPFQKIHINEHLVESIEIHAADAHTRLEEVLTRSTDGVELLHGRNRAKYTDARKMLTCLRQSNESSVWCMTPDGDKATESITVYREEEAPSPPPAEDVASQLETIFPKLSPSVRAQIQIPNDPDIPNKITHEPLADRITNLLSRLVGVVPGKATIVDMHAHCGGNTLSFIKRFGIVHAYEISLTTCRMLKSNVELVSAHARAHGRAYGSARAHTENSMTAADRPNNAVFASADVLFMDPEWLLYCEHPGCRAVATHGAYDYATHCDVHREAATTSEKSNVDIHSFINIIDRACRWLAPGSHMRDLKYVAIKLPTSRSAKYREAHNAYTDRLRSVFRGRHSILTFGNINIVLLMRNSEALVKNKLLCQSFASRTAATVFPVDKRALCVPSLRSCATLDVRFDIDFNPAKRNYKANLYITPLGEDPCHIAECNLHESFDPQNYRLRFRHRDTQQNCTWTLAYVKRFASPMSGGGGAAPPRRYDEDDDYEDDDYEDDDYEDDDDEDESGDDEDDEDDEDDDEDDGGEGDEDDGEDDGGEDDGGEDDGGEDDGGEDDGGEDDGGENRNDASLIA